MTSTDKLLGADGTGGHRRDSVAALLAALRVALKVPVVRRILLHLSEPSRMDELLRALAGESCSGMARFLSVPLAAGLRVATRALGGDWEGVRAALRDPAIRRGLALLFRGLALYGITVPQKLPAPFLIVWDFTNMCNFRCMHCYQRASKPLPTELTLGEKLRLVEQLDKAGVAAVALSGGEPTIHPHYFDVVRALASRGIYVATATNGWMMAEWDFTVKARRAGLRYVEISIDHPEPSKHDRFRGVPGAWERATKAVRNAVRAGIHTAVATTITRFNVDEIEDMVALADELGAHKIVFFNFIPVGKGVDMVEYDLTPEEREEVLKKLWSLNQKYRVTVLSTAPQYARISLQSSGGERVVATHFYEPGADRIVAALAEYIGGCGAGRIYAAIEPDGTVTPCVFMPIPQGNVREREFADIWRSSRLFQQLRDRELLHGYCGECPFKYICGGCRARAYAYLGDPLGPDPGCIYNKAVWEELVREWERRREEIRRRTGEKQFTAAAAETKVAPQSS